MRKNTTVSAKYAKSLHADIRRRDKDIEKLAADVKARDESLRTATVDQGALQRDNTTLAKQLEQMGQQLGDANQRTEGMRQIADTSLLGLSTLAASTNDRALVSTALALVRDGRAQLAKAKGATANGAQA